MVSPTSLTVSFVCFRRSCLRFVSIADSQYGCNLICAAFTTSRPRNFFCYILDSNNIHWQITTSTIMTSKFIYFGIEITTPSILVISRQHRLSTCQQTKWVGDFNGPSIHPIIVLIAWFLVHLDWTAIGHFWIWVYVSTCFLQHWHTFFLHPCPHSSSLRSSS